MKYNPKYLKELGIDIKMKICEFTMFPKLIIKIRDKSFATTLTKEYIEDIRMHASLSKEDMIDYMMDDFLETHPKYLRKIKLDKINETIC